ncbi:hypothetical protein AVEN_163532-1 [Araneus ventricosus]|uniref:Uncharacterized protein n=1 Tax=Araneus ventricosus TaxID=182803 RepID=A0A4Y2BQI2_ARAVE|nr:hypothetical protein AVEN_163532-1 [Araneus ventricosus]
MKVSHYGAYFDYIAFKASVNVLNSIDDYLGIVLMWGRDGRSDLTADIVVTGVPKISAGLVQLFPLGKAIYLAIYF